MTKFEELQAQHERLLEQSKSPENVADFVVEVQREIQNMCVAAEDVPAPRERDQLRAILRFWASYVYDHTGTYPDTTLRPALNKKTSASPPPSPKNVGQGGAEIDHDLAQMVNHTSGEVAVGKLQLPIKPMLIIVSALAVCLIVFTVVLARTPNVIAPASVPTKEISAPEVTTSTQALAIESKVVTGGPSPFDPNAWAVRIQLSATGGNGSYIFWVNSQHLPEASADQFTVDGKGCTAEKPWVGVTSGGEAVSQQLVISSPLSNCPTP